MNVDLSSLSKLLGHLTLESVLSSLLTLLVCLIVIKILSRLLQRILRRTQLDERLQKFLLSGLRILGYIVTVIIVAQSLGIPSTSLVALLSVASLAVSLAVQGLLSNVAGGMMLLTSRPISLGDYVEVAGVTGYVDEIGMVYTKLHTDDGQVIMLPNSSISGERITNYSTLGRRRIVLSIGVSYDAAVPEVRTALLEAAASIETLLDDPAPVVYVTAPQKRWRRSFPPTRRPLRIPDGLPSAATWSSHSENIICRNSSCRRGMIRRHICVNCAAKGLPSAILTARNAASSWNMNWT